MMLIEQYLKIVNKVKDYIIQIENENDKLNIVGTNIKDTNQKIDEINDQLFYYILIIKLDNNPKLTSWLRYELLDELSSLNDNDHDNVIFNLFNNTCNEGYSIMYKNEACIIGPLGIHSNYMNMPELNITMKITNEVFNMHRRNFIDILLFDNDINMDNYLYYTDSACYKFLKDEYNSYKFNKKEQLINDLKTKIESMQVDYDSKINILEEQIQDLYNILSSNNLISEEVPEYNYDEIAAKIQPFKRELIMVNKWRNKLQIAVAVPILDKAE